MRMRIFNVLAIAILAAVLLTLGNGVAEAAALCVNPGGTHGCYSTIQAAVDAARPGATIQVAPGTYLGGVTINKARLKLKGTGAPGTVRVVATTGTANRPASPNPAGVARPTTSRATPEKPNLKLMGLYPSASLEGTSASSSTPPTFGFTIIANQVQIQGFDISGFSGQHDASGILVGGVAPGDTAHPANGADIEHNSIHDNGNGIYLWQSNGNRIQQNKIFNSHDFDGVEGVGILSFSGFGDAQVIQANTTGRSGKNNDISNNTVYNNDRLAIFAGACTEVAFGCEGPNGVHADISGTVIRNNTAYGNGADAALGGANATEAIGLLDAHGGAIARNNLFNNAFPGILVNFSDKITVNDNKANQNSTGGAGYPGIQLNNASGVRVRSNITNGNGRGIYVTLSTNDSFTRNSAKGNAVFDLDWDGTGTMTFSQNHCDTANPSKAAWDCK